MRPTCGFSDTGEHWGQDMSTALERPCPPCTRTSQVDRECKNGAASTFAPQKSRKWSRTLQYSLRLANESPSHIIQSLLKNSAFALSSRVSLYVSSSKGIPQISTVPGFPGHKPHWFAKPNIFGDSSLYCRSRFGYSK